LSISAAGNDACGSEKKFARCISACTHHLGGTSDLLVNVPVPGRFVSGARALPALDFSFLSFAADRVRGNIFGMPLRYSALRAP